MASRFEIIKPIFSDSPTRNGSARVEQSDGRIFDGEWTARDWEAAWSATGTADDVIWPYIR